MSKIHGKMWDDGWAIKPVKFITLACIKTLINSKFEYRIKFQFEYSFIGASMEFLWILHFSLLIKNWKWWEKSQFMDLIHI